MEQESLSNEIINTETSENVKTEVLSSNSTLYWRVFVPVFGTVFFLGLTVAMWFTDMDDFNFASTTFWGFRLFVTFLLLGWIFLMFRTLLKLKRVDASDKHIYVTDYWTTVRYPWSDVKETTEQIRLGKRIVTFHLTAKGRFGDKISFLPGSSFEKRIN
jgi:hypothetical protein